MNIIKKIVIWFTYSSANPANVSLTLKGLIPLLVLLKVSNSTILEETSSSIVNIIVQLGTLTSGAVTLWGAVRKVFLTFKSKE